MTTVMTCEARLWQAGISTMSVRMGAPQVFWTCIVLLEVAYAGAIGVGLMSPVRLCLDTKMEDGESTMTLPA